jgi:hypothetical protein
VLRPTDVRIILLRIRRGEVVREMRRVEVERIEERKRTPAHRQR